MTPEPMSPYAVSKLAGEHYARVFQELYGLDTVSLRYFNVFGPRQDPASAYAAAVPIFIAKAVRNEPLTIFGDGEQTRDFTYVANVVDGVLRACHTPGIGGEMINVATGGRISLNRLLAVLAELVGRRAEANYEDERPGDVRDSQAAIEKAQRLTGYAPTVSLEEGLARTLAWYRDQEGIGRAAL